MALAVCPGSGGFGRVGGGKGRSLWAASDLGTQGAMNFKAVGEGRCIAYSLAGSVSLRSAKFYLVVGISLMLLLFFDPYGINHFNEIESKFIFVSRFGGT